MAQLIHIIDPTTDKPGVELKEWVVIDLAMLSTQEILETYCQNTDWHISQIVEISDDVRTFPTAMLLVVA